MAKSIITQDGHIVNYSNIVFIYSEPVEVEYEEENTSETIYCVYADTIFGESIILGAYATSDEAATNEQMFVKWLSHEAFGVYSMA